MSETGPSCVASDVSSPGRDVTTLRETVMCHLARHIVVLDLSGVRLIDASGLGALVFLHTCAYGIGSELKFLGLSAHVRRVLECTKLLYVFDILPAQEIDSDLAEFEPCDTC